MTVISNRIHADVMSNIKEKVQKMKQPATEEFKKTKSVSLPKDVDQEMQSIVEKMGKTDRKMCVNYYITLAVEEYNKKHGKKG